MSNRRVNIQEIIGNPELRRKLMVDSIIATQAREGITTTREQAEAAYDKVLAENAHKVCPACLDRPTGKRCPTCNS
jgi:hypothetical protein